MLIINVCSLYARNWHQKVPSSTPCVTTFNGFLILYEKAIILRVPLACTRKDREGIRCSGFKSSKAGGIQLRQIYMNGME